MKQLTIYIQSFMDVTRASKWWYFVINTIFIDLVTSIV